MAKSLHLRLAFDGPVDVVERVLLSETFNRARDEARGGFDVVYEVLSEDERTFEYRVEVKQFAHGLRGVDKNKVETTSTTYVWDLRTHAGRWTYRGPHGDRVMVSGTIAVQTEGAQTVVVRETTVDIRIPVVGRQVEKKVVAGMQEGFAGYERVLREHVAAASA